MADNALKTFLSWLNQVSEQRFYNPRLIQTLWSGYGACFRAYRCDDNTPVVIKCVNPEQAAEHPRGWQSSHSHHRKIRSFGVEHHFYRQLASLTDHFCRVPAYIGGCHEQENHLMILEDMDAAGFERRESALSVPHSKVVLRWLAAFHATFLSLQDDNVWQEGTYWHFATRQDEWQAMPGSKLKDNAAVISDTLRNARFQTLLHGDAKVANFCFSDDVKQCAGVDFQYTGFGAGVKDVAYFIGSALSETNQVEATGELLQCYFDALVVAVNEKQPTIEARAVVEEWRELYDLACADFYRFLAGWSPEHHKINKPLRDACHRALNGLR